MSRKRESQAEAFVKLPKALLQSAAWRSLSINGRRLLDFLMLEHMAHAGQRNGLLIAPRRQLEEAGISARHVSAAIEEAEAAGLIDVKRGTGRRPSVYALTWLPLSDGTPPTRRWACEGAVMTSEGKSLQMTSEGIPLGYPKGSHKARSNFRREVANAKNKGIRREAPSKKVLTKAADRGKNLSGPAAPAVAVQAAGDQTPPSGEAA